MKNINNKFNNKGKTKISGIKNNNKKMPTTTGALEQDNLKIENINDIIVNSYENILFSYKVFDLGKYFYFEDLQIGQGKYKIVYFGLNKRNKSPIIVKIDNISKFRSLQDEFKIIKIIENPIFFPKAIDCFTNNKSNYIIEYMLGPTLEKFVNIIGVNNLTKNTIYRIGIDLLYNIRHLHSFGFLHLDLKLDNIVQLWEPVIMDSYIIHFTLIDFNFAIRYKLSNGKQNEKENISKTCGNYYFASINALEELPLSTKDDLISICYILINLCLMDNLPWKNIEGENNEILKKKIALEKKSFNIYETLSSQKDKYKEIIELYNEIEKIDSIKKVNYLEYIEKLKKGININKKENCKLELLDWEKIIIEKLKKYKRIRRKIKDDNEIKELFKGYPELVLIAFCHKYENILNNSDDIL